VVCLGFDVVNTRPSFTSENTNSKILRFLFTKRSATNVPRQNLERDLKFTSFSKNKDWTLLKQPLSINGKYILKWILLPAIRAALKI